MFLVDTNIFLYAANRDALEHGRCRELLEGWRAQSSPWYLTWGIVYEFLRVATHPRVFRRPLAAVQAWSFMQAVLSSPTVVPLVETEQHQRVCAEVLAELPDLAGNLVFDAHIAILMREHGIGTIYTRDADFHRFPFLKVVDPIRGSGRAAAP